MHRTGLFIAVVAIFAAQHANALQRDSDGFTIGRGTYWESEARVYSDAWVCICALLPPAMFDST
jgi:hypothetical protein